MDENKNKRLRKMWYLGVGIGVPVLSLIISLSRNLTPDVPNSFFKPQYQKNSCYFEGKIIKLTKIYSLRINFSRGEPTKHILLLPSRSINSSQCCFSDLNQAANCER